MARAISSFPVPVSPKDQHRGVTGRNRSGLGQYALQRRALSHNLFEVEFGTDFLFEIELFAGQLLRKLRDLAVGSSIVQRYRYLRRDLLKKTDVRRGESVGLLAGKIQGAELAFAGGQRNTAERLDSVFQHSADIAGLNSHQIFTSENLGFPLHQCAPRRSVLYRQSRVHAREPRQSEENPADRRTESGPLRHRPRRWRSRTGSSGA